MLRPTLRPVRWLFVVAAIALAGAAPATAQPRALGSPYLVKMIGSAQYPGAPARITAVGDTAFFATDNGGPSELWKSDGTEGGTVPVSGVQPAPDLIAPLDLVAVGSTLFFTAYQHGVGRSLWKSDGTQAGTVLVKDFDPFSEDSPSLSDMTDVNGVLYFLTRGVLWRSDGTAAGTQVLRTFPNVDFLANLDGLLVFMADDGTHGTELWRSDGTPGGTAMVADLNAGAGNGLCIAYPLPTNIDGSLYFVGNDGAHGCELWQSDGTAAGTRRLTDINPGAGDALSLTSTAQWLVALGSSLIFYASDGATGFEPWAYDRATGASRLLRDIVPGPASSGATSAGAVGANVVFIARDARPLNDLWRSDGTPEGTQLVRGDASPGFVGLSGDPVTLPENGGIVFGVDDGTTGTEPWASDGMAASTKRLKDIASGKTDSRPMWFTVAGGHTFFSADDVTHGRQLWALTNTPAPAPPAIALSGDTAPSANESATFTVQLGGAARAAREPITYIWRASGNEPQRHSGGTTDSASFTWPQGGVQYVTVTARQGGRLLGGTTITAQVQGAGAAPSLAIAGPTQAQAGQPLAFSAQLTGASVAGPITYWWEASEQTPLSHTGGASDTASFTWVTGGSKQVTVTASNSGGVLATGSASVAIGGATLPPGNQRTIWLPLVARR